MAPSDTFLLRTAGPLALLAVLSAACWFGWFAWDSTYQTDPADAIASGPYEAWQVLGCALTLGIVIILGARRVGPLPTVATTPFAFTISWALTQANRDTTGLWLVGAVLVFAGVTAGTSLVAFTTSALVKRQKEGSPFDER